MSAFDQTVAAIDAITDLLNEAETKAGVAVRNCPLFRDEVAHLVGNVFAGARRDLASWKEQTIAMAAEDATHTARRLG